MVANVNPGLGHGCQRLIQYQALVSNNNFKIMVLPNKFSLFIT